MSSNPGLDQHVLVTQSRPTYLATAAQSLLQPASTPSPPQWPLKLTYLTYPRLSPNLTQEQLRFIHTKPFHSNSHSANTNSDRSVDINVKTGLPTSIPTIKLPSTRSEIDTKVTIRRISTPSHPAKGEYGLFAARSLGQGEVVGVYLGYVHGNTGSERREFETRMVGQQQQHQQQDDDDDNGAGKRNTNIHQGPDPSPSPGVGVGVDIDVDADVTHPDSNEARKATNELELEIKSDIDADDRVEIGIGHWDTSSYDLSLSREHDMGIDGSEMGNETRFVNDYRRVAAEPNAEFVDCWVTWLETFVVPICVPAPTPVPVPVPVPIPDSSSKHKGLDRSVRLGGRREEADEKTRTKKRKVGMRGVAIAVLQDGKKRKGGISAGEEILVNYGKGYWAAQVSRGQT